MGNEKSDWDSIQASTTTPFHAWKNSMPSNNELTAWTGDGRQEKSFLNRLPHYRPCEITGEPTQESIQVGEGKRMFLSRHGAEILLSELKKQVEQA